MRTIIVFTMILFTSFNINAQTEKAKERFMRRLFNDFKKNRLDQVVEQFVDSAFLDELINESKELELALTKKYSRAKIHKQRFVAKERFRKSLERAYLKYTDHKLEGKLSKVTPEGKIYKKRAKPIETFGIKYQFYLNEFDGEMTISKIIYDQERKRFAILSDRVRAYLLNRDAEVASQRIEEVRQSEMIERAVVEPTAVNPNDLRRKAILNKENRFVEAPKRRIPISASNSRKAEKVYEKERIVAEDEDYDIVAPPPRKIKNEVFQFVEQMPEFPGGEKAMQRFIARNINYPSIAKDNGIEGRVYISFVVEVDGGVSDAKILRDIGGSCGKEALRVINSMPNWKPGKQKGLPVKVKYNIPISFKLK